MGRGMVICHVNKQDQGNSNALQQQKKWEIHHNLFFTLFLWSKDQCLLKNYFVSKHKSIGFIEMDRQMDRQIQGCLTKGKNYMSSYTLW